MHRIYLSLLLSIGFLSLASQVAPVMGPINGADTVCSAPAAPQQYSASASNSPNSYTWTVVPSNGVVITNSNSPVAGFSFPNTNFNYTIYCQASNAAGTSAPVSFTVDVYETPTVTFSGVNTMFCQGSSTNLSASPTVLSGSSTMTYSWSPSAGLSGTTGQSVIASPSVTTTYTLLVGMGICSNTAKITLTVQTCVGIEDFKQDGKNRLLIYPNPSSGNLNIKSATAEKVQVFNQLGQAIKTLELAPDKEVQISGLTNGIYFIRTEHTSYKVVVNH